MEVIAVCSIEDPIDAYVRLVEMLDDCIVPLSNISGKTEVIMHRFFRPDP
jgi:hypothetical protein